MIYYFCPESEAASGGIRRLYRHVQILCEAGLPAAVLHHHTGFRVPNTPPVPVRALSELDAFRSDDVVVVPEGFPSLMQALARTPARCFAIALSFSYLFETLADGSSWRSLGVERALCVNPRVAELVEWSLGVPAHTVEWSVDPAVYEEGPEDREPRVVFLQRKASSVGAIRRALAARDPARAARIEWRGLDGLRESEWAHELQTAGVYLALSTCEGLHRSVLEAMACGTLVAGFHALGLRGQLVGAGPEQNAVLVENGDWPALTMALAPVLDDLADRNFAAWQTVARRGRAWLRAATPEREAAALLRFWREALALRPRVPRRDLGFARL
ncbi:MAG: glycosyltransferase [Proteobacteria bacterium]|nr:glycosyltransferase [Pseudomonadota bacterium]